MDNPILASPSAQFSVPLLVTEAGAHSSSEHLPGFHVLHSHPELQLVQVLCGSASISAPGVSYHLTKGDAALINSEAAHLIRASERGRYRSAFIAPEPVAQLCASGPLAETARVIGRAAAPFAILCASERRAEEPLAALERIFALDPYGSFAALEVTLALGDFVLAYLRAYDPPTPAPLSRSAERAAQLAQFIQAEYARPLTLAAIAEAAHVSETEALRCFRAELGTTPWRYLTEVRLTQAAQLLERTSTPIARIAEQVGYAQPSHFGKLFKEQTGLTPRAWRASARASQE